MKSFFEFLNYFGIHISESSPPIVLFSCSILVLSIVALSCFINIMLYYPLWGLYY